MTKTRADAARTLLNAGWTYDEIAGVLSPTAVALGAGGGGGSGVPRSADGGPVLVTEGGVTYWKRYEDPPVAADRIEALEGELADTTEVLGYRDRDIEKFRKGTLAFAAEVKRLEDRVRELEAALREIADDGAGGEDPTPEYLCPACDAPSGPNSRWCSVCGWEDAEGVPNER